jgi:Xaa-Pro aminopeptidase
MPSRFSPLLCVVAACTTLSFAGTLPYRSHDNDYPPEHVYAQRRATVLQALGAQTLLVVPAADVRNRSNDVDYEYRQSSTMLYLTGYLFPAAVLVLSKDGVSVDTTSKRCRSILAVTPRNPKREQWNGTTMGIDEARALMQIDTVVDIAILPELLRKVLPDYDTLMMPGMPTPGITLQALGKRLYADTQFKSELSAINPTIVVELQAPIVNKIRMVKDTSELRLMRKAISISIHGHTAMMKGAKPGMAEYQLEALMEYQFNDGGAESEGYPSIVGSNYNACVLHHTSNRRTTMNDDLVLADCGAEYHGYTADITRTFPIDGTFSNEQLVLYNLVLEAQNAGIAACRVGRWLRSADTAARKVITAGLVRMGIATSEEQANQYFPHGTSHFLGLDVHDVSVPTPLAPNMVLTVEPGVYIPAGSPCDKKWWDIGIRIEDDILVTANEPENLSEALPRKAADIEQLMATGSGKP